MNERQHCDHLIKVVFIGGANVGKTCLIERLFSDQFELATRPTIGVDFRFKQYMIDDRSVGVTLWDTAGAEKYSSLTASYFRGAHAFVLVYDVTTRPTLEALRDVWLPEVRSHTVGGPAPVCLVVGNKTDLRDRRDVTPEEGAAFAREHGCMYKETSAAAQDDNVHDALVWGLISTVLEHDDLLRAYARDSNVGQLQLAPSPRRHGPHRQEGCC